MMAIKGGKGRAGREGYQRRRSIRYSLQGAVYQRRRFKRHRWFLSVACGLKTASCELFLLLELQLLYQIYAVAFFGKHIHAKSFLPGGVQLTDDVTGAVVGGAVVFGGEIADGVFFKKHFYQLLRLLLAVGAVVYRKRQSHSGVEMACQRSGVAAGERRSYLLRGFGILCHCASGTQRDHQHQQKCGCRDFFGAMGNEAFHDFLVLLQR